MLAMSGAQWKNERIGDVPSGTCAGLSAHPGTRRALARDADVFRTTIWVNASPMLEPVLCIVAFGPGWAAW
jgi:hypothetical protein